MKTVREITNQNVLSESKIISSHTKYKEKQEDNGCLKIKARIAPNGNEDGLKNIMKYTSQPTNLLESTSSNILIHYMDVKYKNECNCRIPTDRTSCA